MRQHDHTWPNMGVGQRIPHSAQADSQIGAQQIAKKAKEGGGIEIVAFSKTHEPAATVLQHRTLARMGR
jgi:hypothetical protein